MNIMDALKRTTENIWSKTKDGLNNKVDKISGKSLSTNDYTETDRQAVSMIPTELTLLDGKLYMSKNGTLLSSGVTLPSGGSSGGGGASITLNNLLSSNEITIAYGESANLIFEYGSSESKANGIAYIYLSDNLKKTYPIVPGENIIDIGDIVGEGINNIKLTVSDIFSNSKSLSYIINAINLKLTSTFDDSQIFDSNITIRYVATGAISKDLHLVLDFVDTVVDTTSETGKQRTYIIDKSKLSHGSHDIVIYLSANINGTNIVSNKLYYSIVFAEPNMTAPIISSVCTTGVLTQGEQAKVSYLVYDPVNMESEVSLIVYSDGQIYSEIKRIVSATKQTWTTRDLPIGNVLLKIVYGANERVHNITVSKNDVDISIKKTDLKFNLTANGKSNRDLDRDTWESNGITATLKDLNYESTGWVSDDSGDSVLRLSGRARAVINTQPFLEDSKINGRTIEICLAIKDVNNTEAIAMSCFDGNIGFQVKADKTTISSEQSSVSCYYTDEEKICISFVIEPKTENRLLYIYLNGIISGVVQYPDSDNWQHQINNAKSIEIGSSDCSIDLYYIREYTTMLSHDEILNNYIASIQDINKRLTVYENNDICDIYGNLSFEKLKNKTPIFVATGPALPAFKGDKKKMQVSFSHPEKPSLDYTDSSTMNVQGTSSQFYIRKNYKSKTSSDHMIDTDKLPTNEITLKADYMDSSGFRNTGGVNYVNTLYGDAKVPPQLTDSRVRVAVFGYPCVMFWKLDSSTEPEFIGKYNYNYDKSSNTYGFTSDYPDAYSIEFSNNTSDMCLFHGEITDGWEDNFEYRYPDEHSNIEDSGFKEVHSWIVSTYQDAATNDLLPEVYVGVDGASYTNDTAEYRLAKFKKEFNDHLDMDFSLIYYIFAMVGVFMDSLAKNMFFTTFDKKKWYPYWYDLDSCWGVNNEGVKYITPFVEDIDTLDGGSRVFNGQHSTLWTNFRQAFGEEIAKRYAKLRSNNLLSYDKTVYYYITNQSEKWSEIIFNYDADYKYISMLRTNNDATNLSKAQGTDREFLKFFAKARFMYLDSKYYAGDYPSDLVSMRIYTPSGDQAVTPNANITVTPYNDMYAGVRYKANGNIKQIRAKANVPVVFEAPNETFNDTESAIYGASNISSLGDLSALYCGSIDLSKATKLVEIIIGNSTPGYNNSNLKEITVGTNKLLRKIDIQNCPSLVAPLVLTGCQNIEEIYAQGSSISSVELPSSGYLSICKLPATITNLTIINQQYIQEFTLEGYDNLTTLRIEDAVNIPVEDIMLHASNLNRIRLLDVSWDAESEAALKQTIEKFKSCLGLDASGNNTDKAVVTGRVKISSVSDKLYNDIYENFPDLIVDDNSGTPYIINFLDRNGNSLYVTRVAEGANVVDPIAAGLIERPSDIVTDEYTYEFVGWSTLPQNVHQHYKITPIYKIKYTINYYNGDNLVYQYGAYQGDSVVDPVSTGKIETPTKTGTSDITYKFSKWDNLPINVQSSVNIYAQYDTYWAVRFWNDNALYLTEWIIDGGTAVDPKQYFEDYTDPTRESTAQYDYHFSSWGGDFTTPIIAVREFHAEYTSTIRRYNVYFYNGNELIYTVENVQYGSSTSYSGATPVKTGVSNPEDYVFKGWIPAPENITGETECYAFFKYTGYLFGKLGDSSQYGTVDNPNWDKINAYWTNIGNDVSALSNGTLATDDFNAKYQIGGRMIIPIELSDGTSTVADVEIIAHNHDNLADNSGKAILTFFCKDLPQILQRMNVSTGSVSGYKDSSMREFANGELLDALPNELKSIIKPVLKISDDGSQNKKLITTTDSCWLASYDEVGFINGSSNLSGQGELYSDVFSDDKDSREKYIVDNTDTGGWWLRSSVYFTNSNSTMFWRVQKTGAAYTEIQTNQFYVAFGFCI